MSELEAPALSNELYRAQGIDVPDTRPYLTGDVFRDVALPGFGDKRRNVTILTHPCSMRDDGVSLRKRLLVAEVREGLSAWIGDYDKMPLPDAGGGGQHSSVWFSNASSVETSSLEPEARWLVLSDYGLNLLQQQLVFYLTRAIIESYVFQAASEHVYEEVELTEEWLDQAADGGYPVQDAHTAFHDWLREDIGGESRQALLLTPQRRSEVAREARREAKRRYGGG